VIHALNAGLELLDFLMAAFLDDSQYSFGISHLAYLTSLVVKSPVPLRHVIGSPDCVFRRNVTEVSDG